MSMIDVEENRSAAKWTAQEKMGRVLWQLILPLFKWSPRIFWAWRRAILRMFRAKVGPGVHVYPTVKITIPWNLEFGAYSAVGDCAILYALGPIRIGERVTISQGAHICAGTHDLRDSARPLLKPPIDIGEDTWICADAFIGPGVVVGPRSVVGARAVVMKSVAAGKVVAGNPATVQRDC